MVKGIRLVLVLFCLVLLDPLSAAGAVEGDGRMFYSRLDSHLSQQYTDDLPELLKKRRIRVLTTFSQTNFFLYHGRLLGFEYALLKDYEKSLNKNISRRELQVVLEFIPVTRDRLIPDLLAGYGDVIAAGLTITPERRKKAAFTRPYLKGVDEVVVANKKVVGLNSLYDLAGRRVYVQKSSSYYNSLLELNRDLAVNGKPQVKIRPLDENLEIEDILELINSGGLGITVVDSHNADVWAQVLPDIVVRNDLTLRTNGEIAWAYRKDNPILGRSLNKFLKSRPPGGRLGNIYFNRYFTDSQWIKNPVSVSEHKKFDEYKKLIQQYAAMYDFDWLLIMAVAYQESGLNNKKRSSEGAVGIMQVLPRTARAAPINIKDVKSPEQNIHAGVKYLAYLRDHYFLGGDISPEDRIRLAVAAYNAGPGRIEQARRLARKMGLNPDVWFRNVELAALKLVGRETVKYVGNVNKYYLIYRSEERAAENSSRVAKVLKTMETEEDKGLLERILDLMAFGFD